MRIWISLPILALMAAEPLQAAEPLDQPKIDLTKCGRGIGGLRSCMIADGKYIFMTEEVFQNLAQQYHVSAGQ